MCRAISALVVASEDVAPKLRRAAGLEVQVVGIVNSPEVGVEGVTPDILIIHAPSGQIQPAQGPGFVWVGPDAPDWAHAAVVDDDDLSNTLPGAIVKALIIRRSDPGRAS